MKTPTPIEIALQEAGLDQRKSNILKTLLRCIEGSPLWLARLFITEPISQRSQKELLTKYNTYAISYNVGGTSAAEFRDVSGKRKLPEDFFSLAKALGYNGTEIRSAWLYVHSFIEKHKKLQEVEEYSAYSAFVLKGNIANKVDDLLRNNRITDEDREKVLALLERLIIELGGNLNGYSQSDPDGRRMNSLMNRLGNRIFTQLRRRKFGDAVRDILNELEGFLHNRGTKK